MDSVKHGAHASDCDKLLADSLVKHLLLPANLLQLDPFRSHHVILNTNLVAFHRRQKKTINKNTESKLTNKNTLNKIKHTLMSIV